MATIPPYVRHMVVCDDILPSPTDPRKPDIHGVLSAVRSNPPGSFPVTLPQLCVYLELSGGRGTATLQIVAAFADTGEVVFGAPVRTLAYPADPVRVVPVAFKIRRCVFRRPGLYWIQFWHDGRSIAEQSLTVE